MDINKVKELAEILKAYDLTKIKLQDADTNITLEKNSGGGVVQTLPFSVPLQPETEAAPPADYREDDQSIKIVKSPMVGTFYTAQSEGGAPFVTMGSRVKKGDTLAIIESMKLMNDITAEYDGEVIDICLGNGDVVEYGQVIFALKI